MKGYLYTENEILIKTLKIGKTEYKIYSVDVLKFKKNKNNINHIGFILYDSKEIFIKKTKNYKNTINHEITHAFIYEIIKNTKLGKKKILKQLRSYEPFIESLSFLISQNFNLK